MLQSERVRRRHAPFDDAHEFLCIGTFKAQLCQRACGGGSLVFLFVAVRAALLQTHAHAALWRIFASCVICRRACRPRGAPQRRHPPPTKVPATAPTATRWRRALSQRLHSELT